MVVMLVLVIVVLAIWGLAWVALCVHYKRQAELTEKSHGIDEQAHYNRGYQAGWRNGVGWVLAGRPRMGTAAVPWPEDGRSQFSGTSLGPVPVKTEPMEYRGTNPGEGVANANIG